MQRLQLSARTIADPGDTPDIETVHLGEAPGYRALDRYSDALAH